ncbi:MAG: DNA recombination protein RmuC [Deltaproteobacteria bacterium]|nr:MAG: DNA recombination protein RmuC [Deltaproteobacteria bacterium]PIE74971.1 MAG: DNA recombination protein RmuC [Deltaproteobacteria bacterium]
MEYYALPAAGIVLVFCLIFILILLRKKNILSEKNAVLNERLAAMNEIKIKIESKEKEIKDLNELVSSQKIFIKELELVLDNEKKSGLEKINLLVEAKENLKKEFEVLASKVFESRQKSFQEQSHSQMKTFLQPFREQLFDFKAKIEENYLNQTKDSASLKQEVQSLKDLNLEITKEASNLASALKGNNKTQGQWGEMMLESILDKSGLVKGRDYIREKSFTEENKRKRPDVILYLPEGRHIVIDSKVSLVSYLRYCEAKEQNEMEKALKQHIESVKAHIEALSKKAYHNIEEINSPDIVFMFMPVEHAFFITFKNSVSLIEEAYEKGIAIVTPSTLIGVLKITAGLWRLEKQNKSAEQLFAHAKKVYEKLIVFLNYMEDIENQIKKLESTYEKAAKNLYKGKGSLVTLTSDFEKFGIHSEKKMPESFV